MVGIERRERVLQRLIEEEMRESFLDYSMSVIVQRALPDVRDGLKPVHRRILYAMSELGLNPARPYKKSAAVVGEVLGKYHPHGDAAVYDSLVRMVQDFSLRYPLVDGQGNFGSIDGDNAAAYRYTEARLAPIALELLRDLEKDTVEWSDTFDNQRQEPKVVPALLPNLLVNGSSGIAVGMSTNVPPHNLREVAAAVRHLLEDPDCDVDALMEHLPGPDFPTGGMIVTPDGIRDAYATGRGRIVVRARLHKEQRRDGKEQIVVTELPYGVSKSKVIEQIAELVRRRKVEDLSDLRDESDRDGMRIVIELKRGAKPKPILQHLFRHTYLQATFGAIMIALDDGVPREFTLKQILERYRDHRLEVIRRRSTHDLEKAREEAHIAEGLLIALDQIDAVIATIRKAADRDAAAKALRKKFELSEAQADAILNMRLARLTALERSQLEARLKELREQIEALEALLGDVALQRDRLLAELDEVVQRFGDPRRTRILSSTAEFAVPDLAAQEDWVVTLSHEGFVKRIPLPLYRRRVESGKPLAGMERHDEDFLERVFLAGTSDTLLVFTGDGKAHAVKAIEVPEASRSSRGKPLHDLLGIEPKIDIVSLLPVAEFSAARYALFTTEAGTVKRTPLDQFSNVRAGGIAAINIRKGDRLLDVQRTDGTADVLLATRSGRVIRFPEEEVPPMGRATQGVRGIQLRRGDAVIGMVATRRDATLGLITEKGTVRRLPTSELNLQKRGGLGSVGLKVDAKTGPVIAAREVLAGDQLVLVTQSGGSVRVRVSQLPERASAGDVAKAAGEALDAKVVDVAALSAALGGEREGGQLDLIGEE